MSTNDDLQRNRKIFEMLAGYENAAYEDEPPVLEPLSPPPGSFEPERRKAGSFSLGFGGSASHENDASASFSVSGGIDFPVLSKSIAQDSVDPVESLYRRLETEARRSSQLSIEEEF